MFTLPETASAVSPAPPPQPPVEATQAIEGLALAEVLDPDAAAKTEPAPPVFVPPVDGPPESEVPEELPAHYAVMTQSPGPVRRLLPYALVALLSVGAGVFYLANVEATAEAVDVGPGGRPILFTQTAGPAPASPPAPLEPMTEPEPVEAAEADIADVEDALRRQYEEQLAGLRRELEEARRLARPAAPQPQANPARTGSVADLPADSMMRAAVARPAPAQPPAAEPVSLPPAPEPEPRPSAIPEETVVEKAVEPPGVAVAMESAEDARPETPPLSLAFVNPQLISRAQPRYPEAARRMGRGATVTLRVLVGLDGRAVEVERTSGKAGMGFDRAAELAAKASTWKPGTRGGEPTEMWADLRYEFKP